VSAERKPEYLVGLVREACKLPTETEWVEFKVNNDNPQEIGEYVSALSNAAALCGKAFAHVVWGVRDDDHAIVGTDFDPRTVRVCNEELENWLLHNLRPRVSLHFYPVTVDGQAVVLLEIGRAAHHPVGFMGTEHIRVGSYKKKLKDFPEKERELWRAFDQKPFENGVAADHVSTDEVLGLLDYPAYFELVERPLPEGRDGIVAAFVDDQLIRVNGAGAWDVTNLGALLFAKRLDAFHSLKRKAVRVIQYRGAGRTETVREQVGTKGYASGFEGLVEFINGLLPSNEMIAQALRKTVPMFPELAVRELVANALIHQDLSMTGAGPTIEIFDDRIEVTNPGEPIVDTQRFVDTPPRSRNEALASLMRRVGICEERGSGIDKVVFQVEFFQLPAPLFEVPPGFTRVVLFAHKALSGMDKDDRIRACYLHACLKYVTRSSLTNTSLRERFGIEEHNSAVASRIIKEAVEAGAIGAHDPDSSKRLMRYVPWWALPDARRPAGQGGGPAI
jgi:ATP-dependent DNA helicase RecG